MITIISGNIDSGKTRYLKKHYEQESEGDGFLSVKHITEGMCTGYDLYHLKTGKSRAFIRLKDRLAEDWDEICEIGRFSFSGRGMLFAKEILKECKEGPVYIDEIGPVELWQKKGLYNEVRELIEQDRDLFITLRPTLMEDFHNEFGLGNKTKIITLK